MQTRFVFVLFMVILLLAACGGSPEPALEEGVATATNEVVNESSDESVAEPAEDTSESSTVVDGDVEESPGESAEQEADAGTSGASAEGSDEEAVSDMVAGRPASGVDTETGMEINPDVFGPGDEFVVRGTIISMNLTPTVSPEFLIEAPSGRRYRIRSQDIAETYFDDGAQLRPHEYRQGMLAQATVSLASDAGPADILHSQNLTLLRDE